MKKRYWHSNLIGRFYGIVLSSKRKSFSQTLYQGNFLPYGVFAHSILTCLLMKLKLNMWHKPAKQSIRYNSKDSRWPVYPSYKQNHKKWECPKRNSEVIWRFLEHGKRDDRWKPATICSTKNSSPVQEVEGGELKAESFIGLVKVNPLLLQQLI